MLEEHLNIRISSKHKGYQNTLPEPFELEESAPDLRNCYVKHIRADVILRQMRQNEVKQSPDT